MRPIQRASLDLTLPAARPAASSHLPDITNVISWRTWEDGLEEARRRRLPILAFAEPSWANSSQRIAFRLQQDDTLRDQLTNGIIPVLVNPDDRPDLIATWQWVATALTGTAGPPLMVFLTHEGLPFLSYCTMQIEGNETYPSLGSLVQSLTENYPRDADSLVAESQALVSAGAPPPEETPADPTSGEWDSLRQRLDLRHGGLDESPKNLRPTFLWSLLDAHAAGDLPEDIVAWLRTTLIAMVRGGTWDQVDRGFHRCARDERWVIPHFEKPIPLNAQLTAVYARAAAALGDETFQDIASRLVSFCMAALQEGVDAIGSDTGYYTWTSRELLKTLDPALVQVVTLHYDIKPVDERQALRRVVEMEQMDRFSHEDIDVLRTRLMRGRAQLRAARLRRPAPAIVSLPALAWRAETIRWLLVASEWLDAIDVAKIIPALERLIDGRVDPTRGFSREDGSAWLEDQAALLAAFLTVHDATHDSRWLDLARELGKVLMQEWWSGDGWLDRPGDDVTSRAIIDDILPSTLGTLAQALRKLGALTGERSLEERASETERIERRLATKAGHWSAAVPG